MSWVASAGQDAMLQAAYLETAEAVGRAFARAVEACGAAVREPRFETNPNDPVSRYVEWWLELPAPYDSMSCELNLLVSSESPEVFGRIAAWKYLGHGVSDNEDLWRSDDIAVHSPEAAAAALRTVGAELVRQCDRLDLRPYFAGAGN